MHLIDRTEAALAPLAASVEAVFAGDAADRAVLDSAGIADARSVLLPTNDDAMNIYLAVYCRRLNPRLRIVSRITHERNLEAIHRAGADFVLSYTTLGIELSTLSTLLIVFGDLSCSRNLSRCTCSLLIAELSGIPPQTSHVSTRGGGDCDEGASQPPNPVSPCEPREGGPAKSRAGAAGRGPSTVW